MKFLKIFFVLLISNYICAKPIDLGVKSVLEATEIGFLIHYDNEIIEFLFYDPCLDLESFKNDLERAPWLKQAVANVGEDDVASITQAWVCFNRSGSDLYTNLGSQASKNAFLGLVQDFRVGSTEFKNYLKFFTADGNIPLEEFRRRVRAWEVAHLSGVDGLSVNLDFLRHVSGEEELLSLFRNSTDSEFLGQWWLRCHSESAIPDFNSFIADNPKFTQYLGFIDGNRDIANMFVDLDPVELFYSWKQLDDFAAEGFMDPNDLLRTDYARYIYDERVDEAVHYTRYQREDVITTPPFNSLNFVENVSLNNWSRGGDRINAAILNSSTQEFDLRYKAILNTALSKLPNTNKQTLWRASSRADVENWAVGDIKTWDTFFASTHKLDGLAGFMPGIENHNVVFIVQGNNTAKHIESISYYGTEFELLSQSGKRFEVLSNGIEAHPVMGTAFEDAWLSHPANPTQNAFIRVIRLRENIN